MMVGRNRSGIVLAILGVTVVMAGCGKSAGTAAGSSSSASTPSSSSPAVGSSTTARAPAGPVLTGTQVLDRCKSTYAALKFYDGVTVSTSDSTMPGTAKPTRTVCTAHVQYAAPGKIRVEGTQSFGGKFAYISDGIKTVQQNQAPDGPWTEAKSVEMAIASATGTSQSAGTTIPALLTKVRWGNVLQPMQKSARNMAMDSVDGHNCYLFSADMGTIKNLVWIDSKTFLIRRVSNDVEFTMGSGTTKLHIDQRFSNEILNQPIPANVFTLPKTSTP